MGRRRPSSPLPPDPADREDIMSPGQDADPDRRGRSPLPPEPAGREDVLDEGERDETDTGR